MKIQEMNDSELWEFVLSHPIAGGEERKPDSHEDDPNDPGSGDEPPKETIEERVQRLEEENESLKKSNSDTKGEFHKGQEERSALKARLDEIIARQSTFDSKGDEDYGQKIGDELFDRVSKITDEDPSARSKSVYREIGKVIGKLTKEAQEQAIRKVEERSQSIRTQTEQKSREFKEAETKAKIAIGEEFGLDEDSAIGKIYPAFIREVERIQKDEPMWFKAIPAEEQFVKIARKVKAVYEKNKKANEEHQEEAGGMLGSGSKVKKKSVVTDDEGGEGEETLAGALGVLHKQQKTRAGNMFKLAQLSRG